MPTEPLTVAAIQMHSEPLQLERNLIHAEALVEQAVRQGARLVLLPELMPGGYRLTEEIQRTARPFGGAVTEWLTGLARRLDIHLGTTFLEKAGADYYNAFALATPSGRIAGRVRKSPPASVEAYFYRAGDDAHYIDTDLGRIGVGICYENLLHERLLGLHHAGVDLVLQPSAAGRPLPFLPGDVARFERMLRDSTPYYARALGVPVAMANQAGPLCTPLPGGLPKIASSFPGLSAIVDSDGTVKARLGEAEGVIVADVRLDPSRKVTAPPPRFGRRWAVPVPWYAFIWPLTQKMGERHYAAASRKASDTAA